MIINKTYAAKKSAMIKAGRILSRVLEDLRPQIQPGISTKQLNAQAEELIKKYGGQISFNKVPSYYWATCMSVNEIIVHGIPNNYRLKEHDLLKLDIGVYLNGYHVDYSDSFYLGTPPFEVQRFMDAGRQTLRKIIGLAKAGVHIGVVSQTIEQMIQAAGYKVIYSLTGHTVGRQLHEDPLVPQFLDRPINKTPIFKVGNAYALEIIYSLSDHEVVPANKDGWSLKTKHGSLGCCFENTVFIEADKTTVIVN